uniref:Complement C3/4/5 macroglobulin domain-containing protein n=1 Tax=Paramormyrops kingsleyae TaxID=1676925 RepID=A0A3B3RZK3_9TELE
LTVYDSTCVSVLWTICITPNLLRVGNKEKVFVEAQEYTGGNIEVEISVKDFPAKNREFFSKKTTLTSQNKFLDLQEIEIREDAFDATSTKKQYVYLQAKFPQHQLEKVVLLSFQAGYIFVQTDKTIYTPTSTGKLRDIFIIRVETVMEELQPEQQARKNMVAQPYLTYQNSQNYLHIGIPSTELAINTNLLVNLNLKNNPGVQDQISHFTYLVCIYHSSTRIIKNNQLYVFVF